MNTSFKIGDHNIGAGQKQFLIAEVAQAHDGSLGYAHAFIDLAKECGADAVKFQTHIAREETTREEDFRVRIFPQDKTRYEYWQRMEFTPEQWAGLANHAREARIVFLSSAFSFKAIELLESLDMPAWKVASGEVLNFPLLEAMCKTKKPILLSSGMSAIEETDKAVDFVRKQGNPVGLFQCTTKYPTPLEDTGLNVMEEFAKRYNIPVGLSDHSANPYVPMLAMARGASMIEVHLCLHPRQFGPDTSSSLTPEGFKMLSQARDVAHVVLNARVEKNAMSNDLQGVRGLFQRSLALKDDQKAGTVLTADMITLKKPGTGLPAERLESLVGKSLAKDVAHDRLLREEDLA
jgi:N,N'-diacetyllegionaminate synthase